MINLNVGDPHILGRIKSGLFRLVDGHFYFGNEVFKIRYDLLENQNGKHYVEHHIFDKYDSLLDLDYKEAILCKCPLLSHDHHRMVYLSSNQKLLKPKRIIILPYLHERKIYLNQIELHHKYFYNVVEERDIGDSDNPGDNQIHTLIFAINCTKHNY